MSGGQVGVLVGVIIFMVGLYVGYTLALLTR